MKYFLVCVLYVMCFMFLVSCSTVAVTETPVKPADPVVVVEAPPKKIVLAWGESKQDWTDHLIKEIDSKKWNPAIENYCKNVGLKECVAHAISIMARYESSFKTGEQFTESFNDSKGNPVISRGLLQLSFESASQKAYSCGLKTPEDLHDAKINLSCGVNIVNYWMNKDLVLMAEPKKGCARYWSVCRASSKSNAKIKLYLEGLK